MKPHELAAARAAGLFDPEWYARRYPDVARSGLDPMRHYLRIGRPLLRDPGPGFSTRHYLALNPDVAASGCDPLIHYLRSGRAEGRSPTPPAVPSARVDALARLTQLRGLLETGGLDHGPLAELQEMAEAKTPEIAALACEVLAVWHLGGGARRAPAEAHDWFARLERAHGLPDRLRPLALIAAAACGRTEEAARLVDGPEGSADLDLARSWLRATADERLGDLCAALARHGLPGCTLDGEGDTPFDRLQAAPGEVVQDGPLVSVLVAAHDAERTIVPALRSVCAQGWRALEILVIDDASADETPRRVAELAAADRRIRLIRLERNRGAYAARNAGLAEARGAFVTLHDADDWMHPDRIARQAGFLLREKGFAGCLSTQVRLDPGLRAARWTGDGRLVHENLAALMVPAELFRDHLGAWQELRASADSEAVRRLRQLFGARAVPVLEAGPLCLQRDHGASATADPATGMGWFYYGARREYFEAQRHYHARAPSLRYGPGDAGPVPVPDLLRPGASGAREIALNSVYAGLLMLPGADLDSLVATLGDEIAAGRRVGLVPLYSVGLPAGLDLSIAPELRAMIDGTRLRVLCYGERVRAEEFHVIPRGHRFEPHRYLPQVQVAGRVVLAPGTAPAPV
jgi:hypothetical protein